jgi:DNA-binding NarL/FixJ family response regulator
LVVDDHPIFRLGIVALIDAESDLQVCAQAFDAEDALIHLAEEKADAAVIDLSLPGTASFEFLIQLREKCPDLPVLVLSFHDEQSCAIKCLRSGASGYLMKKESGSQLVIALRTILGGSVYVSPAMSHRLSFSLFRSDTTDTDSPLNVLTGRECEILQRVGMGESSRQIAGALSISTKTVESHRLHIKEKLEFGNAKDMASFAIEWMSQFNDPAMP